MNGSNAVIVVAVVAPPYKFGPNSTDVAFERRTPYFLSALVDRRVIWHSIRNRNHPTRSCGEGECRGLGAGAPELAMTLPSNARGWVGLSTAAASFGDRARDPLACGMGSAPRTSLAD